MHDQGNLFEEHGAATDPATSHEAAVSVNPESIYGIIIEAMLAARTGMTTHEMAHSTGIGYQTITPRIKPMRLKGWVYNTGEKREWMGSPGYPATKRKSFVWQLTRLREETEKNKEGI